MPFAPLAPLLQWLPKAMAVLLDAHRVPRPLIEDEVAPGAPVRARTDAQPQCPWCDDRVHPSRRGLAGNGRPDDLLALSVELARTPTSPLYETFTAPDRALAAFVEGRLRSPDGSF